MNRSLFFTIAFFVTHHNFITSHNIKTNDYQQVNNNNMLSPFSINNNNDTTSLLHSIKKELRDPSYAQKILPDDFTRIAQLVQHGARTQKNTQYISSVFNIFSNQLGGAPYVNAYAFTNLLAELPLQLKPYFTDYKEHQLLDSVTGLQFDLYDRFKENVNSTLYLQFNTQYEFFKNNPDQFLDEVAQQITDLAQKEFNNEHARFALIHFINTGLSKLIWHPEDHAKIWITVKTVANHLEQLVGNNIIEDIDYLDMLFWTLVHRFNFFIDIFGADLPDSFFESIKTDIMQNQIPLLDLEEQDDAMQTKRESLEYCLLTAKAKNSAYQSGLIIH